jgi:hypothetical protein
MTPIENSKDESTSHEIAEQLIAIKLKFHIQNIINE